MSNCFIEAIKQKIFNGYTIYCVKTKKWIPHFCWYNYNLNIYQHYTIKNKFKFRWWNEFWFQGKIDTFPQERIKAKLVKIF